jgi:hypothetical protein
MNTSTFPCRALRRGAALSWGFGLVLVLGAAAPTAAEAGAGTHAAAAARAVASGGAWGNAEAVPGLAALNTGGFAEVISVSCARQGDCSAGGFYLNASSGQQGFVVGEAKGVWGAAEQVPGLAALNRGGGADVTSVSCARAGDCSAGGFYTVRSGGVPHEQGFVASERKGVWGAAEQVPGLAALNRGGLAEVNSVSCARAGSCSAGGDYVDAAGREQGFVVGEAKGVWGAAEEVPGLAALNRGGSAQVNSVSCARAGGCSAGGFYRGASSGQQGFVVGEAKGVWGSAEQVPGLAALSAGGAAQVTSVSCARAGSCSAGGSYGGLSGVTQGFVAGEAKGVWGAAEAVPGLAALNQGGLAQVTSVSCARAGSCGAGGDYVDAAGREQGFVAGEAKGVWGAARAVPGLAALNRGGLAEVISVSCARQGGCSAGGSYRDGSFRAHGFVVGETKGAWGTAEQVPGLAALGPRGADVFSVSCASAGRCSAGGGFSDHAGTQAFVVNES